MASHLGADAVSGAGAERKRVETLGKLENGLRQAGDWYLWGPYVSERQWGTVREDYSAHGTAWEYLPHDHARSRAYRWGEDGLAGFCDVEQRLCLGLALWNGRDPILKERIFGLTGNQGNHGEDAKEYWWYLDATPSHSWNRWRYHYPQAEFPYAHLVDENAARSKHDPEFELLDTGIFDDDRYWIVEAHYAKGDPFDVLLTVQVTNAGPDEDTLHVLPTAWYRNTWAWEVDADIPVLRAGADEPRIETEHPFLGKLELVADDGPGGEAPELLFCDNETNDERLFGSGGRSQYPKDGINDHVVSGRETVNPEGTGTKAAFHYRITVAPGETVELRVRLRPAGATTSPWADFAAVTEARRGESDAFYGELTPPGCSNDEANVMRQALAGMLWGKQLYYYDVQRWLTGDPTQPTPPEARHGGRNAHWLTFEAFDIMSMPDPWEYPWFAAWDSAFHCVALAHVDPAFAKYQLTLLCREWFQHPNGALPAYEWAFDDVNPPVQAWAALQVFVIDGGRDVEFLSRIFDKLLVNFTWWVNRLDEDGSNLFEGGFLGLDNIGPIDRSNLPSGYVLEQADATGWMAAYALTMAVIAAVLNRTMRPATDLIVKFLEHFSLISEAIEEKGLWDDEDGFYYDQLRRPDGSVVPVKVRSMVGVLPLMAFAVVEDEAVARARTLGKHFSRLLERHDELLRVPGELVSKNGRTLVGVVGVDHLLRVFRRLLDEDAFLSPYGLRAVSRWHLEHPYHLDMGGYETSIDYEPAESTTSMFGGNSNWRGPVWFPVNYLVVDALLRYARYFGDGLTMEYPTGSGEQRTFAEIGEDLRRRLISLFLVGEDGRRPCHGWVDKLQTDPAWKDNIFFYEYFHGDNGAGLGASHQTGWTGIVADLIRRHGGADVPTIGDVLRPADRPRRAVIVLGPQACGSLDECRLARVARRRRARRVCDGNRRGPADAPLPRAARPGRRRAVGPDARARGARARPRRRRRSLPACDRRMGVRRGRSVRPRAPRLVHARPGRAAVALAGRERRPRARDRDGTRPLRGRDRPPSRVRRPAGRARAHAALHVAERPRRALRERRPGGRDDRGRLRVRGRVPRRGRGLAAGRRLVSRRAGARGGGPRAERPRGPLGGGSLQRRAAHGRRPRGDGGGRPERRPAPARRGARRGRARASDGARPAGGRHGRRSTSSSCLRRTSS